MRSKQVVGLCLGASVLMAAQAVYADPERVGGPVSASGAGVQVQIDPETGRKDSGSDSDAERNQQAAARSGAVAASPFAASKETKTFVTESGLNAAILGPEHQKYLVMTVDKDGKRSLHHDSLKNIESGVTRVDNNVEEK